MKAHSQAGLAGRSGPGSEVTAFFARLTHEQTRYLDSLAELRQLIEGGTGQLAKVAAQQARLSQQFLDAQRSIMRVRADIDAEVAGIDEASAVEVEALLAEFDLDAALGAVQSLEPARHRMPAGIGGRSNGAVDLDLDLEVMSVAGLVDAAFEPDDPQGDAAQQRLRELLDDWWQAEVQEGRASVDDAQARAVVRLYTVERRVALLATSDTDHVDDVHDVHGAAVQLPDALHDALAFVDAALAGDADGNALELEALLASLSEALADPAPASAANDVAGLLGPAPAADQTATLEPAPEDAFDRFWGSRHGDRRVRSAPERLFKDVLLPAVLLVSLVVLLLAWVG